MTNRRATTEGPDPYTVGLGTAGYPEPLRRMCDPPRILYVRGTIPDAPAIAVVGSRECTEYGRRTAHNLAAELVRAGFVVVSGLARGIDAAAHRGALDAGGKTVAVLPCGIDRVYPPSHRRLAGRIASGGALVTEFEPGAGVARWSFPERNRIIAGLTAATIVVEAARRSGAKITAGFALDYDREVMAVPGPIGSPTSAGANALLAEGAGVYTGIDSLIEHLPYGYREPALRRLADAAGRASETVAGLGARERRVFDAIPAGAGRGVEQLVADTGLAVGELLATLTEIEARGLIRSIGNQRYERA